MNLTNRTCTQHMCTIPGYRYDLEQIYFKFYVGHITSSTRTAYLTRSRWCHLSLYQSGSCSENKSTLPTIDPAPTDDAYGEPTISVPLFPKREKAVPRRAFGRVPTTDHVALTADLSVVPFAAAQTESSSPDHAYSAPSSLWPPSCQFSVYMGAPTTSQSFDSVLLAP